MRRPPTRLRLLLAALALVAAIATPIASAATTVTLAVTGAAGERVDGSVSAFDARGSSGGVGAVVDGVGTVTRPDGRYQLLIVADSMDGLSRWYSATEPGGVADRAQATVVTFDGTPLELTMTLPMIASLSGTVTDAAGTPVPDLAVFKDRDGVVSRATTDQAGRYSFPYAVDGSTVVTTASTSTLFGGQVELTIPATGAVVQDFVLGQKGAIAGTVVDSGRDAPVAYIQVSAYRALGRRAGGFLGVTRTDRSGRFTLSGLGGQVLLRFQDPFGQFHSVWSGGADQVEKATSVLVPPHSIVTHREVLTAPPDPHALPHTLAGTVTGPDGPVPGMVVTATSTTGDELRTQSDRRGRWAILAPDGQYTLGFAQSVVWPFLEPDTLPWFPHHYPSAWSAAGAARITVIGGVPVDGLDTTTVRSGRLRIAVTAAGGQPRVGYRVIDTAGVAVLDVNPGDSTARSIDIAVRPGVYRLLVSGVLDTPTAAVPLVPQWATATGGGRNRTLASPLIVGAGQTVTGAPIALPSALAPVALPLIAPSPGTVGGLVRATRGTWNYETGTTYAYRWMRDGIGLARTRTFAPRPIDAGTRLTVVVTATNGPFTGTARARVTIARLTTSVSASVASGGPGAVRATVTVDGGGLTPTGRVVLMRGPVPVTHADLVDGRVVMLVGAQPAGLRSYRVRYLGSARHRPGFSRPTAIVVG